MECNFDGAGQISQSCCSANPSSAAYFASLFPIAGGHFSLLGPNSPCHFLIIITFSDSVECSSFFQMPNPPLSSFSMAPAYPHPASS
jgi:hypothetical protein